MKKTQSRFCNHLFIIILTTTFISLQTNANQTDSIKSTKRISLDISFLNFSSIDEIYSSLKFTGRNFDYGSTFDIQQKNSTHKFEFHGAYLVRNPKMVINPDNFYLDQFRFIFERSIHLNFRYSYLRKTSLKLPFKSTLFLASDCNSVLNMITTDGYYPEIFYFNLAPGFTFESCFKPKHCASIHVAVPIANITFRNNYSASFSQNSVVSGKTAESFYNTKFASLNELFSFYSYMNYSYALTDKIAIGAGYNFFFLRYNYPRLLTQISGRYTVSVSYQL